MWVYSVVYKNKHNNEDTGYDIAAKAGKYTEYTFLCIGCLHLATAANDILLYSTVFAISINIAIAIIAWIAFVTLLYYWLKNRNIKIPNTIQEEINTRYLMEDRLITKNKQLEWTERTAKICYGNWDVKKNEIQFSDGAEDVLGLNPRQTLSFNCIKAVIIPEDRIKIQRFIESIAEFRELTSLQFRIIADSKLKYIRMNAEVYHNDETHCLMQGTFQDITEEQMFLRKIEDKNETLKQIAGIQSHEVRGPLASMLGLMSLIDEKEFETAQNKFIISGLKTASEELDQIIKKIIKKAEGADVDLS